MTHFALLLPTFTWADPGMFSIHFVQWCIHTNNDEE